MQPNEIIEKAFPIINEQDCSKLQLEALLEKAEISLEEFYQSFADLDDFFVKAFLQLCEHANALTEEIDKPSFTLEKLFTTIVNIFKLQMKYRYLMLNLSALIQSNETIKDKYLELTALRKAQLIHLFSTLEKEGYFYKEKFPGNFENLSVQILMLSDYWLSHNSAVFGPNDIQFSYYSKLIFSAVLPYLTDKGLKAFKGTLGYG
ncbi:TetR/AcrR family transcriptional regulator [Cyclobacterium marinum]|uniref:Tetracyclin repressor-like C-terminal domain-containing protein n=1 Tax=Cyclobacterium marinum (strain ATCC 25205 / DSM 745 / LMG 13164 / NCIMB 1802) TaxID=880070 RepID=G0IW33_CYCMS|nr:TetR/AcrR family transcriptional regulator [Cyclobacterium marinum]AEL26253.1 hypothetical protein Cycma_2514 [Cyclobacterium marinum DSM 745]